MAGMSKLAKSTAVSVAAIGGVESIYLRGAAKTVNDEGSLVEVCVSNQAVKDKLAQASPIIGKLPTLETNEVDLFAMRGTMQKKSVHPRGMSWQPDLHPYYKLRPILFTEFDAKLTGKGGVSAKGKIFNCFPVYVKKDNGDKADPDWVNENSVWAEDKYFMLEQLSSTEFSAAQRTEDGTILISLDGKPDCKSKIYEDYLTNEDQDKLRNAMQGVYDAIGGAGIVSAKNMAVKDLVEFYVDCQKAYA